MHLRTAAIPRVLDQKKKATEARTSHSVFLAFVLFAVLFAIFCKKQSSIFQRFLTRQPPELSPACQPLGRARLIALDPRPMPWAIVARLDMRPRLRGQIDEEM
jgi:hypothetical protein